jgi:hypothetical protein
MEKLPQLDGQHEKSTLLGGGGGIYYTAWVHSETVVIVISQVLQ